MHNIDLKKCNRRTGRYKTSERVSFLLPVDTERDYTGIRCLRIGEWSADSEMKEKTMWMWFGKHKKQIVLWSVIILIAVPLIVYGRKRQIIVR